MTKMSDKPSGRVPQRRFYGEAMSCQVLSLHMVFEKEQADVSAKTLLGHKIPDFQRTNDKWTRAQQVAFIESLYMGANIGAYMVNMPHVSGDEFFNVLLDGLQRLTALKSYFLGEFGVKGEDGVERFWPDLNDRDRAHLLRMPFPWILTRYSTRAEMIEAYERHNFGGTPHTEEDRLRLAAKK